MKSESINISISDHNLHRVVMSPDDGVPVNAVLIFYHGQGDYAERYADVMHAFTQRGVRCVVTELPGHGRSLGRRGHCGDEALLDTITQSTVDNYVTPELFPYGVMGHSMGGLLAARHIVLAGMGQLPSLSFAWLSSPLANPTNGRTPRFVKMVKIFARLLPALTISTKVRSADCRIPSEPEQAATKPANSGKHQLWHDRVSLGWGASLIGFAEFVNANIRKIAVDLPILITQGSDDTVCPADQTRKLYEAIPSEKKEYLELEGMLHEPFKGEGSKQLFAGLEAWLDDVLPRR